MHTVMSKKANADYLQEMPITGVEMAGYIGIY